MEGTVSLWTLPLVHKGRARVAHPTSSKWGVAPVHTCRYPGTRATNVFGRILFEHIIFECPKMGGVHKWTYTEFLFFRYFLAIQSSLVFFPRCVGDDGILTTLIESRCSWFARTLLKGSFSDNLNTCRTFQLFTDVPLDIYWWVKWWLNLPHSLAEVPGFMTNELL